MSAQSYNQNDDPHLGRRAQAESSGSGEQKEIKFVSRALSEERLAALKEFIKHARAEEILAIRRLYGENKEVLVALGLEHLSAE